MEIARKARIWVALNVKDPHFRDRVELGLKSILPFGIGDLSQIAASTTSKVTITFLLETTLHPSQVHNVLSSLGGHGVVRWATGDTAKAAEQAVNAPPPQVSAVQAAPVHAIFMAVDQSGELWPVSMALSVDDSLYCLLVGDDYPEQIVRFFTDIGVSDRVIFGRTTQIGSMKTSLKGEAPHPLADFASHLKVQAPQTVANFHQRCIVHHVGASTDFYIRKGYEAARGAAARWVKLCESVYPDQAKQVQALAANVPQDVVLVWYRAPKIGDAHLKFTMELVTYGVDWLEVIDGAIAQTGLRWTTVGGLPPNSGRFQRFVDVPECTGLYGLAAMNKGGRAVRLLQFYFFSLLRTTHLGIGWRSGSVEGCFSFNGMATIVLDAKDESGYWRASKMCKFLKRSFQNDVVDRGAKGVGAEIVDGAQFFSKKIAQTKSESVPPKQTAAVIQPSWNHPPFQLAPTLQTPQTAESPEPMDYDWFLSNLHTLGPNMKPVEEPPPEVKAEGSWACYNANCRFYYPVSQTTVDVWIVSSGTRYVCYFCTHDNVHRLS